MHCQTARYLSIPQSTGTTDPYSFSPSLNGAENRLFHSPPVGNAALNLFRYRFGDQSSIKLRLSDFLDI
jgi:hypothetical protein